LSNSSLYHLYKLGQSTGSKHGLRIHKLGGTHIKTRYL